MMASKSRVAPSSKSQQRKRSRVLTGSDLLQGTSLTQANAAALHPGRRSVLNRTKGTATPGTQKGTTVKSRQPKSSIASCAMRQCNTGLYHAEHTTTLLGPARMQDTLCCEAQPGARTSPLPVHQPAPRECCISTPAQASRTSAERRSQSGASSNEQPDKLSVGQSKWQVPRYALRPRSGWDTSQQLPKGLLSKNVRSWDPLPPNQPAASSGSQPSGQGWKCSQNTQNNSCGAQEAAPSSSTSGDEHDLYECGSEASDYGSSWSEEVYLSPKRKPKAPRAAGGQASRAPAASSHTKTPSFFYNGRPVYGSQELLPFNMMPVPHFKSGNGWKTIDCQRYPA